jgi:hypothetical protein
MEVADARATRALLVVKALHTAIWAIMAAAILLIPAAALAGAWRLNAVLIGLVTLECVVLALNRMRCPLTDVAAGYTSARSDNFDIFLPLWLARYNKQIFGPLFAAGVLLSAWLWYRG